LVASSRARLFDQLFESRYDVIRDRRTRWRDILLSSSSLSQRRAERIYFRGCIIASDMVALELLRQYKRVRAFAAGLYRACPLTVAWRCGVAVNMSWHQDILHAGRAPVNLLNNKKQIIANKGLMRAPKPKAGTSGGSAAA
jgi:hypothetical protein